jgi:hypothetical protein
MAMNENESFGQLDQFGVELVLLVVVVGVFHLDFLSLLTICLCKGHKVFQLT